MVAKWFLGLIAILLGTICVGLVSTYYQYPLDLEEFLVLVGTLNIPFGLMVIFSDD